MFFLCIASVRLLETALLNCSCSVDTRCPYRCLQLCQPAIKSPESPMEHARICERVDKVAVPAADCLQRALTLLNGCQPFLNALNANGGQLSKFTIFQLLQLAAGNKTLDIS